MMIKSYKTILAAAVVGMMGLGACTGDLDLMPTDPQDTTAGSFADNPDAYMQSVFADVAVNFVAEGATGNTLGGLIDGGFGVFQRAIFVASEVPTDEACWLYYQNDAEYGQMPFGVVSPATVCAIAPYYRMVVNASLCNDFINNCKEGYFDGANADNMAYLMTQARTLREICMYYLLDLYGNVPYIDDDTPVGSTPEQFPAAEVYHKLVAEMEETLKAYDANRNVPYGYLSIDAHEAYLVKLYLNAGVYCGTPDWANALRHAKAIINRHQGSGFKGSGLCMNYAQPFSQNNQRFAPGGGGVNEILWTLPTRREKLETWGAATNMLAAMLNTNGKGYDVTDLYNYQDAWNCIVSRRQLVEKFEWNETSMATSPDQRVRFWLTSKHGFSFGMPLSFTYAPECGYPAPKFSNWVINDDGSIDVDASGDPVKNGTFNCDYPMVRLAEIYLSAAEAILNGAGDRNDALTYVNYIRERAGMPAWVSGQLSLSSLRDERQRELYTECTRRTDLRRYGQWISGYTWDYKGSSSNPSGQDFVASFDLYPLPSVVVSMAGYQQNTGY